MSELSKLIPREALERISRWELPDMNPPPPPPPTPEPEPQEQVPPPPTVEEIEAIQRQAYDEGYAQGLEEGRAAGLEQGRAAGKAEYDARVAATEKAKADFELWAARLEVLLGTLSRPFEELDEQVERELATLAMETARQVVRREIKLEPGQVVAAVREAAALLPVASRDVELHLCPGDAEIIRRAMSLHEGKNAWQLVEDPLIEPGGCQVLTENSRIDATVERRLGAAIAQVLGDQRHDDDRS